MQVSTIPAPGLSAKLIPYLLEDLVYLTVLDVGAHMPPRIEVPEIVSMRDLQITEAISEAEQARQEASRQLTAFSKEHLHGSGSHDTEVAAERERLQRALEEANDRHLAVQTWAEPRHLADHYGRLVRTLDELASKRNTAARLAKGTVPRWFAALPCERPFEVWETRRDRWGDAQQRTLLVQTERLEAEYLYPLERRLIALVQKELGENRRVMVYFEQNDLRSMARRLEWVLKEVRPWTLPNSVAAEDRQQAILQAVGHGHPVVIVPYRRVNEGLNLQSGIDSIIWVEMALNLFMLDQASRRAWRLGKREEVRIYYVAYANTAGHTKLRKLGQQSGAAAAFAGEPARGALIAHAGADKTTLARLSSLLEQREGDDEADEDAPLLLSGESEVAQEEAALKGVFAQRAEELRAALLRGRQWLGGVQDDLRERLAALAACPDAAVSVWAERPRPLVASLLGAQEVRQGKAHRQPLADRQDEPMTMPLPAVTTPALPPGQPPVRPSETAKAAAVPSPMTPVPEPVPVLAAVGSRAAVVFGRGEHIALARLRSRPRRSSRYGEPLKRRVPVAEREIPSLTGEETAGAAEEEHKSHPVAMPSLWDVLVAPTSATANASPPLFTASSPRGHTPRQPRLWE